MQFQTAHIQDFIQLFEASAEQIRHFPGCKHLTLLADLEHPQIFFTYSWWNSPEDLENYRHSPLFEGIWAQTKVLFSGKPEAWSTTAKYVFA